MSTLGTTAAPRGRADAALVSAADVARAALLEDVDAADVGDHLGAANEGERVVTHLFACTRKGYVGWRWSVTVTRASRHKAVTVDEVVLIPGDEAIVAPAWVPYRERIQPGDLSPGDLLPVSDEDPRLVPTYSFGDDPLDTDDKAQIREVAQDLGLGRVRTLSVEGRDARRPALVRRRRRPRLAAGPVRAAPLPQLRLPGPHRRPAHRHLRCLRQRRRQRRRPGGQHRPRLRCALRGAARQEARAPAASRPRLRHPQHRRGRDASETSGHQPWAAGRLPRRLALARTFRRRRQYSSPNSPSPKPARQVQSHQVCPSSSSRP